MGDVMRRDRDIKHRRERALEHKENASRVPSDKGWPEWMKDPKLLPKKPPSAPKLPEYGS